MSGATKLRDLQAGTSGMMDSTAMETEEYYNQEGEEWTQKVDTGQLCRVCANPNEYLIPIFDGEGLEHELAMKIEKHLPIKITETDTLPLHICYQCASTLIAWHDLVISCVEADKKLRELQVEDEDDDDDKGVEMFESHSMDSDAADEVDQPSTSETKSQVTKPPASKKATPNKEKKPKLKMVLVKGSSAGTSGQKTVAKTQVAKALEQAKSKEGGNEESASERYLMSDKVLKLHEAKDSRVNYGGISNDCKEKWENLESGYERIYLKVKSEPDEIDISDFSSLKSEDDNNLSTSQSEDERVPSTRIETYTNKDDLTCKYCGKEFTIIKSFKKHVDLHLNVSQVICHMCGKEFRTKTGLKSHIKSFHEGLKDYECEVCGKKFADSCNRNSHRQIHNVERPFVCEICGNTFKTKDSLQKHKISHSNVYSFACTLCEKKFKRRGHLREHVATHSAERQYKCSMCSKEFPTKNRLGEHIRNHTDIRPYACDICGCAFKRRDTLKTHGKTHRKQEN